MIIGSDNPQIVSARGLFGKTSSWMYNLLRHVQPGLMLDVGAAAGEMTVKMLGMNGHSKVIAFEPFPGNWPHFERKVGKDARAVLRPVAAGSEPGTMPFYVKSESTGKEAGWDGFAGYSSAGSLVRPEDGVTGKTFNVEVVRLDDEIRDHVRFAKLDVQGAEMHVLKGMASLLDGGVDMLCMEYDATDSAAIEHMFSRGWTCLDGGYSIIARQEPDPKEWEVTFRAIQSTGAPLIGGWPRNAPRELGPYMAWMQQQGEALGCVYTDLVFVAPHYHAQFMRAAGDMCSFLEAYFAARDALNNGQHRPS